MGTVTILRTMMQNFQALLFSTSAVVCWIVPSCASQIPVISDLSVMSLPDWDSPCSFPTSPVVFDRSSSPKLTKVKEKQLTDPVWGIQTSSSFGLLASPASPRVPIASRRFQVGVPLRHPQLFALNGSEVSEALKLQSGPRALSWRWDPVFTLQYFGWGRHADGDPPPKKVKNNGLEILE